MRIDPNKTRSLMQITDKKVKWPCFIVPKKALFFVPSFCLYLCINVINKRHLIYFNTCYNFFLFIANNKKIHGVNNTYTVL